MIRRNLRPVIRMLMTNPWFSGLIIITIALGVGVNTAMFSVVNSVLLRPLPVEDPGHIVVLVEQKKDTSDFLSTSYSDFLDLRKQSEALKDMAAYQPSLVGLSSGGRADRVVIDYVTGNFFSMLGIKPATGRLLLPGEGEQLGADNLIVLAYSYWNRRFNRDPGIVGKGVTVNGRIFTIIGVAAESFHGPSFTLEPDAYLPLSTAGIGTDSNSFWTKRDIRNLKVLGRLKANVNVAEAQAALNVVSRRLEQQYPESNANISVRLFPELRARIGPGSSSVLPVLGTFFLALAGLVLLVASVNVLNMLLVRAVGRQREVAIRTALGAQRSATIWLSLSESVPLAVLGGIVGIALGRLACDTLQSLRAQLDLPVHLDFTMDWRVLAYTFIVTLLTGILVGITPALGVPKANLAKILHEGGRGTSSGGWVRVLRNGLVVSQIAISLVLLIVAGLFVRSLNKAQHMQMGFQSENLVNFTMDPREVGYDDTRGNAFYQDLLSRVRALPGVQSASLCSSVPFGYIHQTASVYAEGQVPVKGGRPSPIYYNTVDPEYFKNLQISLLRGRTFTHTDTLTEPAVALVNETMARQLWPNGDAIGKRFSLNSASAPLIEVVGITKDAQYVDITDDVEAYFFLPLDQHYVSVRTLQVRTTSLAGPVMTEVQKAISSLAPAMPVFDVREMKDAMNGPNGFFIFRLGAGLAATFGLLGLILAIVGVYGVVSHGVTQRTQEIGIRMALGAQRSAVLLMILKQTSRLVAAGVSTGLLLAFFVSHAIRSLLIGVGATDPLAFTGVSVLLSLVALAASAVPTFRAVQIDPNITLRIE
ncbi:MAG TPA: ABC transporter permease [Candidatus Angelobacter sp.]|nr:ABC transporter permease [Candidatus Angelobacter sp.]